MKKLLTLFLLFGILHTANANKLELLDDSLRLPKPYLHNYFTFSPLQIFEIEPSFQIGYNYNIGNGKMILHEAAYVGLMNGMYQLFRSSNWMVNPSDISGNGFRLRTSIKKYLTDPELERENRFRYISIDLMYKYMQISENNIEFSRLNGQYTQFYDVKWNKSVGAVHLIYGSTNYLSTNSKIIIDTYIGVGLRNKFITDNVPLDVSYSPVWYDDTFDNMMVSLMMGIRLGFGV
jgi:hypothetical protein